MKKGIFDTSYYVNFQLGYEAFSGKLLVITKINFVQEQPNNKIGIPKNITQTNSTKLPSFERFLLIQHILLLLGEHRHYF